MKWWAARLRSMRFRARRNVQRPTFNFPRSMLDVERLLAKAFGVGRLLLFFSFYE